MQCEQNRAYDILVAMHISKGTDGVQFAEEKRSFMEQHLEHTHPLPLIRLTTLGPFICERREMQSSSELTYHIMTSEDWQRRGKALTLLKVLVCQRNRRATRDTLIDLLWTEEEQHEMKDVRGALKTAAVLLRDLLRVGGEESLLITLSMSDELMLAEQQRFWVDADAFEMLIHEAVRVTNRQDALPLWEQAHVLAQGEFLEDERYSEWATIRREVIRGKRGQCISVLADLYTAQRRLDRAQDILWEAATAIPVDEDALCRLLALLEQQERYHAAWQLYTNAKHEAAKDERSLTPRIRTLAKRIRANLVETEPYVFIRKFSPTPSFPVAKQDVGAINTKEYSLLSFHVSSDSEEAAFPFLSLPKSSADPEASESFFVELQERLYHAVTIMKPDNQNDMFPLSRRETLITLATMTMTLLTEVQQKPLSSLVIEEVLSSCVAGITACRQLSRGPDVLFAYSTLSRYLLILLPIANHPLPHQKAVADLIAQGFLLKSSLGRHVEGLHAAEVACQNALRYSELADNPVLYVTALRHLAMIYYYAKRHKEELALYEQMAPFLTHEQIPPIVRSFIYAGWAGCQAVEGQKQDALTSLSLARETFLAQPECETSPPYIDYEFSQLVISEGLAYFDLGEYKNALASFLQVDGLHPKVPIAERGRLEFLNCQALALLCLPDRDREMQQCITYLTAGMNGAIEMKSKQRFEEAYHVYEFMSFVWPYEKKIQDLKEISKKWDEKKV